MTPTRTKADLLLVPGKLVMVAAVKDAQTAQAVAERRGFVAWYWDKRAQRLYGKAKETK